MDVAALIIAVIAAFLAVPPFLQWAQVARRWLRRRDPLGLELVPHHAGDRLLLTIFNRGDGELRYGWCSLTGVDASGQEVHSIYPRQGIQDIWHKELIPTGSEGRTIPMERSKMPPLVGVQWTAIDVRDMVDHHASIRIPEELAVALRTRAE